MLNASGTSSLVRIHGSILRASPTLVLILIPETYGYSPEDIIVLKDDTKLPELSQPTRDNMVI